jgi:hypothetical protein
MTRRAGMLERFHGAPFRRLSAWGSVRIVAALIVFAAAPANGQDTKYTPDNRATGEAWHVEFGVAAWQPPPDIVVSAESLHVVGSDVSAQRDLGLRTSRLTLFNVVLRPSTKHKFRASYMPVSYVAQAALSRTIVFKGQTYTVSTVVDSTITMDVWRIGYEYDIVYRDRFFVGLLIDAKYTDAKVTLTSPIASTRASVLAPIPTLGGIVRVYPAANISVTGECTAFVLPTIGGSLEGYSGRYVDYAIYGTLNFTNNFAVQGGYQSMDLSVRRKLDRGDMVMKGAYVAAVARF